MTIENSTAFTLGELAKRVGGTIEGSPDVSIRGVATIEEAGEGDLTFVANPKYRVHLSETKASAVVVSDDLDCPKGLTVLRTADPYAAFAGVVMLFDPGLPEVSPGIHPSAVVHETAEIAEGAALGPHVVVERGARIGSGTRLAARAYVGSEASLGAGCYLYPGTFVGRGCTLGARVVLHPGVVIGADGFGYAPDGGQLRKIPQLGIVEIGDDVEIGANTCIDRATLGKTTIGRGTKIDNLVQIAHNVAVGDQCVFASFVGVAGSTRIGKGVQFGGQVGVIGHLRIGDGVTVAARGGVIGDVSDGQTVSGFPARPHREVMKFEASLRRLPDLVRRVRALEAARADEKEES